MWSEWTTVDRLFEVGDLQPVKWLCVWVLLSGNGGDGQLFLIPKLCNLPPNGHQLPQVGDKEAFVAVIFLTPLRAVQDPCTIVN